MGRPGWGRACAQVPMVSHTSARLPPFIAWSLASDLMLRALPPPSPASCRRACVLGTLLFHTTGWTL